MLWVWQDSITALHHLDKKWPQECLINLKAEFWPWLFRHTMSSNNHQRSKFSLIPPQLFEPQLSHHSLFEPGGRTGTAGLLPSPRSAFCTLLALAWAILAWQRWKGTLEEVSFLLAQETWQQHLLPSAAALSEPGRWHVGTLNFTIGSDKNSKLKKSSADHWHRF